MSKLKRIDLRDLLIEVVEGLSKQKSRVAIEYALERYNGDYNQLLFDYYSRSHHTHENQSPSFYEMMRLNDEEDYQYLKRLGAKRYKTPYDYSLKPYPIRQKDTRFGMEMSNGFYNKWSYLFDMYQYIEAQGYEVYEWDYGF